MVASVTERLPTSLLLRPFDGLFLPSARYQSKKTAAKAAGRKCHTYGNVTHTMLHRTQMKHLAPSESKVHPAGREE